ncbi:uncharacterized protein LOC111380418 isoform X3 [Olea europaea var. sylvestris]|uniref:uncharacterized protein LOC111380418 isoform X3 n=1 Tax=Olea europaea var. sylvestris TaxID=158386 RepID=UPI000C1CF6F8|nr:uncharacterized protein LOC111380418 isoform X3 [Olea europaea var. sylvestris]
MHLAAEPTSPFRMLKAIQSYGGYYIGKSAPCRTRTGHHKLANRKKIERLGSGAHFTHSNVKGNSIVWWILCGLSTFSGSSAPFYFEASIVIILT